MKLTRMEKMVLNAMRENDYNDALQDGYTWLFCATDYTDVNTKQSRGALSSLIKKELVWVEIEEKRSGHPDESTVGFTEAGEKLFENADGEECSWGGPRLLKVEDDTKNEMEEKKMTVKEMRVEAKELGIKGYSRMSKEDLQAAIESKKSSASEEITAKMYAFTGMFIGEFKAMFKDGVMIVNTKAKGELAFDGNGVEITAPEKARWANRIEVM